MIASLSAPELAETVNQWCDQHGISPVNGQAGEAISVRTIRYYRGLGLLDPPKSGAGQGYEEKHRLQLVAVRLLQAQGLPLSRIQQLLLGRSVEDLRVVERKGIAEISSLSRTASEVPSDEVWSVTPLNSDFLLVSRNGRKLPRELRERLARVLNGEEEGSHGIHRGNERNM